MPDALGRTAMVRLTVTLMASELQAAAMLDALRTLRRSTRIQPGCVGCFVREDIEDATTLCYAEEWATESDMRRRIQSDRFTALLGVMEAAREFPQVQFDFVTSTRGLDYVAEVRQGWPVADS
jgi:quinol monooxygenase YgiN